MDSHYEKLSISIGRRFSSSNKCASKRVFLTINTVSLTLLVINKACTCVYNVERNKVKVIQRYNALFTSLYMSAIVNLAEFNTQQLAL